MPDPPQVAKKIGKISLQGGNTDGCKENGERAKFSLDVNRATGWICRVLRPRSIAFSGNQAFSLVEVLVVISVIGILASIALPNLSNITNRANFARSERNAQSVASLLSAARSAGATNQWTTVEAAVDDLEDTIVVRVGSQDVSFGVPEFSSEERAELMEHLTLDPAKAMVYYSGPTDD